MIDKEKLPANWKVAKFEDLLDYIQPTKYIVESTDYNESMLLPFLRTEKLKKIVVVG
jgi:hypothetical protein